MPLPGFPYATIVGFGVLVVAAGLFMLFGNLQQVPIADGNTRRRRSGSPPPPTRGSWSRPPARESSGNSTQDSARSIGTEHKRRTCDPPAKKSAGYNCIICLDCEEFGRFVKLCCGHHFHSDCLVKWFRASRKGKVCPTCSAIAAHC